MTKRPSTKPSVAGLRANVRQGVEDCVYLGVSEEVLRAARPVRERRFVEVVDCGGAVLGHHLDVQINDRSP
jgi:VanZ family protein